MFLIFSGNLDPIIQNFAAFPGCASSPSPQSSDLNVITKPPTQFVKTSPQTIGENLDRLTKQFEQFYRLQRNGGLSNHSGSSDQQFLLSSMDSEKTSCSSYWSQFTSHTSLSSCNSVYSMNSIYQLDSTQRLTKLALIGQGQFGNVYKGILSR